jgi:ubiquinone/menaquinone biosynthesis C-methylase UbiE
LDLAFGTGIVSRLAEKNGVISIGGDVNPGMLADATERAVGADSIFKTADAQDLPFEDQGFNAIICQQGLQFFPNKAAALSECLRVLKPAG